MSSGTREKVKKVTPKKVTTAKAVTGKAGKEFVSEIRKQISLIRLNLTEECSLNILFDDMQKIDDVQIGHTPFDKLHNTLIDSLDSEMWIELIDSTDEVFEKTLETVRRVREEVRKQIDEQQ